MAEASQEEFCRGDLGVTIDLDLACLPADTETELEWDFFVPLSTDDDLEWDDSALVPTQSFHFQMNDVLHDGTKNVVISLGNETLQQKYRDISLKRNKSSDSMKSCKTFWSVESSESDLVCRKKNVLLQLTEKTRCIVEQTQYLPPFQTQNQALDIDIVKLNVTIDNTAGCSDRCEDAKDTIEACLRWLNGNIFAGKNANVAKPTFNLCRSTDSVSSSRSSLFESYHSTANKTSSVETYATAATEISSVSTKFIFKRVFDVSAEMATQYYHIAFIDNDLKLKKDQPRQQETLYDDFAEELSQQLINEMYDSVQKKNDMKIVESYVQHIMDHAYTSILENYNEFEIKYDIRVEDAGQQFCRYLINDNRSGSVVTQNFDNHSKARPEFVDPDEIKHQEDEDFTDIVLGLGVQPHLNTLEKDNEIKYKEDKPGGFEEGVFEAGRRTPIIEIESFQTDYAVTDESTMTPAEDLLQHVSFRSYSSCYSDNASYRNINADTVNNFVESVLKTAVDTVSDESCIAGNNVQLNGNVDNTEFKGSSKYANVKQAGKLQTEQDQSDRMLCQRNQSISGIQDRCKISNNDAGKETFRMESECATYTENATEKVETSYSIEEFGRFYGKRCDSQEDVKQMFLDSEEINQMTEVNDRAAINIKDDYIQADITEQSEAGEMIFCINRMTNALETMNKASTIINREQNILPDNIRQGMAQIDTNDQNEQSDTAPEQICHLEERKLNKMSDMKRQPINDILDKEEITGREVENTPLDAASSETDIQDLKIAEIKGNVDVVTDEVVTDIHFDSEGSAIAKEYQRDVIDKTEGQNGDSIIITPLKETIGGSSWLKQVNVVDDTEEFQVQHHPEINEIQNEYGQSTPETDNIDKSFIDTTQVCSVKTDSCDQYNHMNISIAADEEKVTTDAVTVLHNLKCVNETLVQMDPINTIYENMNKANAIRHEEENFSLENLRQGMAQIDTDDENELNDTGPEKICETEEREINNMSDMERQPAIEINKEQITVGEVQNKPVDTAYSEIDVQEIVKSDEIKGNVDEVTGEILIFTDDRRIHFDMEERDTVKQYQRDLIDKTEWNEDSTVFTPKKDTIGGCSRLKQIYVVDGTEEFQVQHHPEMDEIQNEYGESTAETEKIDKLFVDTTQVCSVRTDTYDQQNHMNISIGADEEKVTTDAVTVLHNLKCVNETLAHMDHINTGCDSRNKACAITYKEENYLTENIGQCMVHDDENELNNKGPDQICETEERELNYMADMERQPVIDNLYNEEITIREVENETLYTTLSETDKQDRVKNDEIKGNVDVVTDDVHTGTDYSGIHFVKEGRDIATQYQTDVTDKTEEGNEDCTVLTPTKETIGGNSWLKQVDTVDDTEEFQVQHHSEISEIQNEYDQSTPETDNIDKLFIDTTQVCSVKTASYDQHNHMNMSTAADEEKVTTDAVTVLDNLKEVNETLVLVDQINTLNKAINIGGAFRNREEKFLAENIGQGMVRIDTDGQDDLNDTGLEQVCQTEEREINRMSVTKRQPEIDIVNKKENTVREAGNKHFDIASSEIDIEETETNCEIRGNVDAEIDEVVTFTDDTGMHFDIKETDIAKQYPGDVIEKTEEQNEESTIFALTTETHRGYSSVIQADAIDDKKEFQVQHHHETNKMQNEYAQSMSETEKKIDKLFADTTQVFSVRTDYYDQHNHMNVSTAVEEAKVTTDIVTVRHNLKEVNDTLVNVDQINTVHEAMNKVSSYRNSEEKFSSENIGRGMEQIDTDDQNEFNDTGIAQVCEMEEREINNMSVKKRQPMIDIVDKKDNTVREVEITPLQTALSETDVQDIVQIDEIKGNVDLVTAEVLIASDYVGIHFDVKETDNANQCQIDVIDKTEGWYEDSTKIALTKGKIGGSSWLKQVDVVDDTEEFQVQHCHETNMIQNECIQTTVETEKIDKSFADTTQVCSVKSDYCDQHNHMNRSTAVDEEKVTTDAVTVLHNMKEVNKTFLHETMNKASVIRQEEENHSSEQNRQCMLQIDTVAQNELDDTGPVNDILDKEEIIMREYENKSFDTSSSETDIQDIVTTVEIRGNVNAVTEEVVTLTDYPGMTDTSKVSSIRADVYEDHCHLERSAAKVEIDKVSVTKKNTDDQNDKIQNNSDLQDMPNIDKMLEYKDQYSSARSNMQLDHSNSCQDLLSDKFNEEKKDHSDVLNKNSPDFKQQNTLDVDKGKRDISNRENKSTGIKFDESAVAVGDDIQNLNMAAFDTDENHIETTFDFMVQERENTSIENVYMREHETYRKNDTDENMFDRQSIPSRRLNTIMPVTVMYRQTKDKTIRGEFGIGKQSDRCECLSVSPTTPKCFEDTQLHMDVENSCSGKKNIKGVHKTYPPFLDRHVTTTGPCMTSVLHVFKKKTPHTGKEIVSQCTDSLHLSDVSDGSNGSILPEKTMPNSHIHSECNHATITLDNTTEEDNVQKQGNTECNSNIGSADQCISSVLQVFTKRKRFIAHGELSKENGLSHEKCSIDNQDISEENGIYFTAKNKPITGVKCIRDGEFPERKCEKQAHLQGKLLEEDEKQNFKGQCHIDVACIQTNNADKNKVDRSDQPREKNPQDQRQFMSSVTQCSLKENYTQQKRYIVQKSKTWNEAKQRNPKK